MEGRGPGRSRPGHAPLQLREGGTRYSTLPTLVAEADPGCVCARICGVWVTTTSTGAARIGQRQRVGPLISVSGGQPLTVMLNVRIVEAPNAPV